MTQSGSIYTTSRADGEHKKTGQKPGVGRLFFVKSAAFRDTARDAVFPGAGRVPRAGGLVFGVRPDASRGQTQRQAREENREEGEDGPGK